MYALKFSLASMYTSSFAKTMRTFKFNFKNVHHLDLPINLSHYSSPLEYHLLVHYKACIET